MYTPAEISKVKTLYQNLVELNLIRIEELDGFQEPVAHYMPEATKKLAELITSASGFPHKCVVENAMLSASSEYSWAIFAAYKGFFDPTEMRRNVMQSVNDFITDAAMLELTESLFPQAELNSMLKDHHEYLDMVQDNVRRGLLLAEEMDDSAERVSDMRLAS